MLRAQRKFCYIEATSFSWFPLLMVLTTGIPVFQFKKEDISLISIMLHMIATWLHLQLVLPSNITCSLALYLRDISEHPILTKVIARTDNLTESFGVTLSTISHKFLVCVTLSTSAPSWTNLYQTLNVIFSGKQGETYTFEEKFVIFKKIRSKLIIRWESRIFLGNSHASNVS